MERPWMICGCSGVEYEGATMSIPASSEGAICERCGTVIERVAMSDDDSTLYLPKKFVGER